MAGLYVASHVAALFTESINWDEFLLFQRAARAVATGELPGGGRPGLGTLLLLPFVNGCTETFPTVMGMRLFWSLFTFGGLAGFYVLLRKSLRGSATAPAAAALGVALLALVPIFMRWSLQVRTDQGAVALVLWGGVVLLHSAKKNVGWAVLAGALVGLGYLFSQKAIYVFALILLLAAGDVFVSARLLWRRELWRLALLAVGVFAPVALYRFALPVFFELTPTISMDQGLSLFDWYRKVLGFRVYHMMLPTLVPHGLLLLLLFHATFRAIRLRSAQLRPIVVATAILLVGVGVGWFHASAFPYFWMTLGLFPAAALAWGWQGICDMLPKYNRLIALGLWLVLLGLAIPFRLETLENSQHVQRDSFAFIEHNLPSDAKGYQVDGALFCRQEPDPLPSFYGHSLYVHFNGVDGKQRTSEFIDLFKQRQVAFIVHTHRFKNFPAEVRAFWSKHYGLYFGNVSLAGVRLAVDDAATNAFEIIAPGRYRWMSDGDATSSVRIGEQELKNGETLVLSAGAHQAHVTGGKGGYLVYHTPVAPALSPASFHSVEQLAEISGIRLQRQ
jgi:hypothetical protein